MLAKIGSKDARAASQNRKHGFPAVCSQSGSHRMLFAYSSPKCYLNFDLMTRSFREIEIEFLCRFRVGPS